MSALAEMNPQTVNYLVIGAGVTGWSVINFLHSRQENFRVMDTRDVPPYAAEIKDMVAPEDICFGEYELDWLLGCDTIILSPGVALDSDGIRLACQNGVEIIGDIELFMRNVTKPYIAITGSNGKSTVTTLVTDILNSQGISAKEGGNIGVPALDLLSNQDIELYVLELSSFQLETCSSIAAQAAVVLNVSEDHIDRHQSLEEYTAIKMSIYENAKHKVYSRQDLSLADNATQDIVTFGLDQPKDNHYGIIEESGQRYLAQGSKNLLAVEQLPLLGATGELNVLAALALTQNYIKDLAAVVCAIQSFQGLPFRCQIIAEENDVQWINDSKGTNIGATVAAIQSIQRPLVLILGGIHKGGSLMPLNEAMTENIVAVIVFGRDKKLFADALHEVVTVIQADSLESAVGLADSLAVLGGAVLFSPACASFDMFDDYQHRGRVFNAAVESVLHGGCDAS